MSPAPSSSHLVLIPSYNSGALVLRTVREALAQWAPVWVVIDGSTDGTDAQLRALAAAEPNLRVLVLPVNRGKGAALAVCTLFFAHALYKAPLFFVAGNLDHGAGTRAHVARRDLSSGSLGRARRGASR